MTTLFINTRLIKEHLDEVVMEGVRINANFPNLKSSEVAEKLLVIINFKSNFKNYGIIDVKTIMETNIIQIDTYHEEATMHLLKQLVADSEKDIKVVDKFKVIDLDGFDVNVELFEGGIVEELEDVYFINNN